MLRLIYWVFNLEVEAWVFLIDDFMLTFLAAWVLVTFHRCIALLLVGSTLLGLLVVFSLLNRFYWILGHVQLLDLVNSWLVEHEERRLIASSTGFSFGHVCWLLWRTNINRLWLLSEAFGVHVWVLQGRIHCLSHRRATLGQPCSLRGVVNYAVFLLLLLEEGCFAG